METCVGCGAKQEAHPMVGMMSKATAADLGAKIGEVNRNGFVAVPVCELCHQDPTHRKRVVKAHFFPRGYTPGQTEAGSSSKIG